MSARHPNGSHVAEESRWIRTSEMSISEDVRARSIRVRGVTAHPWQDVEYLCSSPDIGARSISGPRDPQRLRPIDVPTPTEDR